MLHELLIGPVPPLDVFGLKPDHRLLQTRKKGPQGSDRGGDDSEIQFEPGLCVSLH